MTLRQGNISAGTIRKVGIQLLHKIKVLHSFNIIHNDIKPANILFGLKDKRNELFIIDYGLAQKQPEITTNSTYNDSRIVDLVFRGNIKFSSLRKLQGYKATKLDDL
jgi:serine/threonine protein kinase